MYNVVWEPRSHIIPISRGEFDDDFVERSIGQSYHVLSKGYVWKFPVNDITVSRNVQYRVKNNFDLATYHMKLWKTLKQQV